MALSNYDSNQIRELETQGFDVSQYMPNGGWTDEQIQTISTSQFCHKTPLWYDIENYGYGYIYLSILSNITVDDIEYIPLITNIILCDANDRLNIDELLVRFQEVKHLTIQHKCENLRITRYPNTLKKLTIKSSTTQCVNIPDTLESYTYDNSNYDNPVVLQQLPNKDILIKVIGQFLTPSFHNLSSLITVLDIQVESLGMNIDNWPLNLKSLNLELTASAPSGDEQPDTYSFGLLPYGLEKFLFLAQYYHYQFEMPPTLKKFCFRCKVYRHTHCFDNLPDSCVVVCVNYEIWPEIEKLPKKCKELYYIRCPEDVFYRITHSKYFKGISCSKKVPKNW